MALSLLPQQAGDMVAAPAGDRCPPRDPVSTALLAPEQDGEPPCDIRVVRSEHGAYASCRTHHNRLVGAMFGQEPFISRSVDARRALRRCEG